MKVEINLNSKELQAMIRDYLGEKFLKLQNAPLALDPTPDPVEFQVRVASRDMEWHPLEELTLVVEGTATTEGV